MAYWSRNDAAYNKFLGALAQSESGGRTGVVNQYGYLGLYQMGEAALIDAGAYGRDGNSYDNKFYNSKWTGRYGIDSKSEFLSSASAQTSLVYDYHQKMWGYVKSALGNTSVESYYGKVVNGVTITESGILGAAHLKGAGAVRDFVKYGRDSSDANGTKVSDYMKKFAGYDFNNDGGGGGGGGGGTSSKNDVLHGNNSANTLSGNAGNDILYGNGGNDKLYGGTGNDKLYGGDGNDYLIDHSGRDHFNGGNGSDTVTYYNLNGSVTANLGSGYNNQGDSYYSIENLGGSKTGSDTLYGNKGANKLYGEGGNDKLVGLEGNDTLYGGTGNDRLHGGSGNDTHYGDDGNDSVYGWYGNDKLVGGNGNDYLDGGDGNDQMWGGAGSDIFKFAPGSDKDVIYDFNPASNGDVIDIRGHASVVSKADLFANHVSTSGNNTIIDLTGGDVLTLVGVKESQLGYEDFWI